ncbi:hypothetical protein B0H17DRAFT_1146687 [Mycena rosella]|uniref:Uncharacterized protein n=1 Tax=Mycena rosella TaxID=1033263 RepID=A0AAD7G134_MYCRO|nr:hypothetical protein B0H17DRAFT_1146687 [Mycena rosella]
MSILKNTTLRVIHVKQPVSASQLPRFCQALEDAPPLKALVKFKTQHATRKTVEQSGSMDTIAQPRYIPPSNPDHELMCTASALVQDSIWKHILYHAMFLPERELDVYHQDIPSRLLLLLISVVKWGGEKPSLALPLYYQHTVLKNSNTSTAFLRVLLEHPSIASSVRVLIISCDYDNPSLQRIFPLLTSLTGVYRSPHEDFNQNDFLIILTKPGIAWGAFCAMARTAGLTLHKLSVHIDPGENQSPAIFEHLNGLCSLDWKYSRRSTFLCAHGGKLTELDISYSTVEKWKASIFELCPNLIFVSIHFVPMRISPGLPEVTALQRTLHIRQHGPPPSRENTHEPEQHAAKEGCPCLTSGLPCIGAQALPRLHEIQATGCVWPTTEREIAKSHWVRGLLKNGIMTWMTDKTGKKWQKRLG